MTDTYTLGDSRRDRGFWPLMRFMAAADNRIMATSPRSDQNWYNFIGLALIIVSSLSGAAMGFTASQIYHSAVVGIIIAPIWAVLMMTFNYGICWTLDNLFGSALWKKFLVVSIILILNFAVALLNSTFVQMQTMEKEISASINADYQKRRHVIDKPFEDARDKNTRAIADITAAADAAMAMANRNFETGAWRTKLDTELADLRKQEVQISDELTKEIQGRVGSRQAGEGPAARSLRDRLAVVQTNIAKTEKALEEEKARRLPERTATLAAIQANQERVLREGPHVAEFQTAKERHARELADLAATPHDGFVDRHLALMKQWARDPLAMLIVFTILFIIEALVVGFKLISVRTTYLAKRQREVQERIAAEDDARLKKADESRRKWREEQAAQREAQKLEYDAWMEARTDFVEKTARHEESLRTRIQEMEAAGTDTHVIQEVVETLNVSRPRLRLPAGMAN